MTKKAPANKTVPVKKKVSPVDAAISKAVRSAASTNKAIQDALVAIAIHTEGCGDWTKINVLLTGLPDNTKKTAIVEWASTFIGVEYDKQAKEFTTWGKDAAHVKENFQTAKDTPWYSLKPVVEKKTLDFDDALSKLIERTEKGLKADTAVVKNKDLIKLIKLVAGNVISLDACLALQASE